jgi:hypothetical protein
MTHKEKHAYRKMRRKHTKALIKLAKEDRDFDSCYLHNLVITKIKHMYEYYSAGNNVWQTDETRIPICVQLNHILQLQDELDHLYDTDRKFSVEEVNNLWKKESELYKSIYTFIGEHMEEWWD